MDSLVAVRFLLAALTLPLLLPGCAPDCRRACRHMLEECGVERPGYTVDECESECNRFVQHYDDDWQRSEARASVNCVINASCSELQTGTPCYDPAVYVW